jgi:hypothetical protein
MNFEGDPHSRMFQEISGPFLDLGLQVGASSSGDSCKYPVGSKLGLVWRPVPLSDGIVICDERYQTFAALFHVLLMVVFAIALWETGTDLV